MDNTSEEVLRRRIEELTHDLGKAEPDGKSILEDLTGYLCQQGLLSEEEQQYAHTGEGQERDLGADPLYIASFLSSLATLLKNKGQYSAAETLYRQSATIRENSLGHDHPKLATSLNDLALVLHLQGKFSDVEQLLRRSLAINEKHLGPDHPEVATNISNLAFLMERRGQYSVAEDLLRQALAIREHALGTDHPASAQACNNLAHFLYTHWRRSAAEPLYRLALTRYETALWTDHPDYARCLGNLAILLSDQGKEDMAEELYSQSLDISEKALGADHLDVALHLANLAIIYMSQGNFRAAGPRLRRSLGIYERLLGPDHPDVAYVLVHLGRLLQLQGHYLVAEPLLWRSLAINEKTLGFDHPEVANSLYVLSLLLIDVGDYSQAEQFLARANAILGRSRGAEFLGCANILKALSYVSGVWRDISTAESHLIELTHLILKWLYRELPLMATVMRTKAIQDQYEVIFALRTGISRFLHVIFLIHLNVHGLLQQIEKLQAKLAKLPGEHQPIVTELQFLTTQLSSSQLESERRKSLSKKRDVLEVQIYNLYPGLEIETIEIEDISAALPADCAFIAFQRFNQLSTPSLREEFPASYVAFILFPDEKIELIDFGPAALLEVVINEALANTLADDPDDGLCWSELSEQLLAPLLPHLQGVKRWFLSLDGELHRVPFHVLHLPGEPDRLLVETVTLQLLTSGRELLDQHQPAGAPSAVADPIVVAAPAFDQGFPSIDQVPQDSVDHQPRSRDMGALKAWAPLPNSAIEGQKIAELLGATLHTGSQATTVTVQQAQRPRVLHIATHGFFLPDQSEPQEHQSWLPLDGHDLLARFRGEDPMLRSGLVFAGANHPVADPSEDDGYLTAQEAVHLDLQGTELVTLSACDAGSGDIRTGEGVYGLQRALIVAGARSMLLSLWPVPDAATCEFMVRFYTLLKQGAGRFDALVAVQREFRQHTNERWRHPYYWGAWQLIGDGGPIEGL